MAPSTTAWASPRSWKSPKNFAADKPRPQRSIAFIAWTLEEQGLLGSEYFAEHPIWPLNHIVGGINLDANLPEGRAHDMVLVGNGASQLEDMLADVLKTQDRHITPDPRAGEGRLLPLRPYQPGQGRRADARSRRRLRSDRGRHQGRPGGAARTTSCTTIISLRTNSIRTGICPDPVQDLDAFYTVGDELANSDKWPNWYKGNEFRAIRDKEMAARK